MSEIFILIGPPGCGKSTYIQTYQRENPDRQIAVISSDDLVEEFAKANDLTYTEAFPLVDHKAITRRLRENLIRAFAENKTVFVDRTNMTNRVRNKWLSQTPKTYKRTACVFKITPERLREQLEQRRRQTGKHIPWSVVRDFIQNFEYPLVQDYNRIVEVHGVTQQIHNNV